MSEFDLSSEERGNTDETAAAPSSGRNLDTILRIPVSVQVVLGSAMMPVSNLLKLGRGAVIPLDHRVGEPVDIIVNGRVIARGEIVVVEDDNSRLGVSLTEIAGPARTAA
jgi:flagellar motor switch protein FliN